MEQIINSVFDRLGSEILEPVSQGIFAHMPQIIQIAILVAILSLIFGFNSMQRGTKIGVIVGLVVIAFLIPYLPELIGAALAPGPVATAAQEGSQGVAAAAGTLSDLAV